MTGAPVTGVTLLLRFLNSPVEEEEEVGFRPLRVKGRPIDKGSVDATQGQKLRVVKMGVNLGQERIIESHTVGPMGANPGGGYRGYSPSKNLSEAAKYCISPPQKMTK